MKVRFFNSCISFAFFGLFAAFVSVPAQSSDQNFPTPVTAPEVRGTIRARDIGDSRTTAYFYAFEGEQGDIFVNVATRNFNGDIDIFTADTLRPLTKIVIYADAGVTETGRIVYLRKPEKLLLRIEGRPPGDDASTFVIKFAGSFIALSAPAGPSESNSPRISGSATDGIRLSAAGAEVSRSSEERTSVPKAAEDDNLSRERTDETVSEKGQPARKPAATAAAAGSEKKTTAKATVRKTTPPKVVVTSTIPPDPLASVKLVIVLKDGTLFERKMSEVLRFSTENRGLITVITKDGKIMRFQLTEVAKVTIE